MASGQPVKILGCCLDTWSIKIVDKHLHHAMILLHKPTGTKQNDNLFERISWKTHYLLLRWA